MTFGDALEALKNGKCMQRAGWNGKNMHIYLEESYQQSVPNVRAAGMARGTTRRYEPVICMFTAAGTHQPGWLASQADMLADDWQLAGKE